MLRQRGPKETTTFKCDGCHQRKDADDLWCPSPEAAKSLASGSGDMRIWKNGKRTYMVVPMVCSKACYALVSLKPVMEWCRMVNQGDERATMTLYNAYLASFREPKELRRARSGFYAAKAAKGAYAH